MSCAQVGFVREGGDPVQVWVVPIEAVPVSVVPVGFAPRRSAAVSARVGCLIAAGWGRAKPGIGPLLHCALHLQQHATICYLIMHDSFMH